MSSNDSRRRKFEPLGASEFAATLNGDNANAILLALKRFTKTVQRERKIALSLDEGNDEGSSSSGDSDSDEDDDGETKSAIQQQPPPAKKFKKDEAWKEDTNAYHVPFVGTAVSRGDVAPVVKGQWPTGLLKTYLAKSPLAVEMTSDDWIPSSNSAFHKSLLKRKQTKLSRAMYRSYLKALAELVTAAIPIDKLRDDSTSVERDDRMEIDGNEPSQIIQPFLSAVMKKRLIGMFHLLVDETDKGKGKPGVYGGCGSLTPLVVRFLRNVARTSITNARLVCRYLDEELSEGVLRAILRPPPPPRKQTTEDVEDGKEKQRGPFTKPSRTEAIRLATLLLQTRDSAVATYICTAGSRERKVKLGILYVAFREGLAKHPRADEFGEMEDRDDYFDSVSDMLKQTRKFLQDPRISKVVGRKLLVELLSRDPLYHLCDLSSHAPPMTIDRSYHTVLSENDETNDGDIEAISYAGNEARRLLFYLLAAKESSPVLENLSSKMHVHSLVNVLLRLLQSKGSGIQTRYFILHCARGSPVLLPELFRMITVPEPKKSFEFMSTLRFVSNLMENGPSPRSCLGVPDETLLDASSPDILAALCPIKLKRQVIGKAMQGGNPLLVLECLKFVRTALLRFRTLVSTIVKNKSTDVPTKALAFEFSQHLPDLQILLALRSKFDLSLRTKTNELLYHGLHCVFEEFAVTLPEQVRSSSFDWMKLVPEASLILDAEPLVQRVTLSCLCSILRACEEMPKSFASSAGTVLKILLRTKDENVYQKCREIVKIIILSTTGSRATQGSNLEYGRIEVEWWLDGLSLASLSDFCNVLTSCAENSLEVLGRAGKALASCTDQSQMNWSIILTACLAQTDGTGEFFYLVAQVASRCLLFQRNPLPFAGFLLSMKGRLHTSGVFGTAAGRLVLDYATMLYGYSRTLPDARLENLASLVNQVFTSRHHFCRLIPISLGRDPVEKLLCRSYQEAVELSRFCIHSCLLADDLDQPRKTCYEVLRQTIPALLLLRRSDDNLASHVIQDVQALGDGTSFLVMDAFISSYQGSRGPSSRLIRARLSMVSRQKQPSALPLREKKLRVDILKLPLLGQSILPNDLVDFQLRLLDGGTPGTVSVRDSQLALSIATLVDLSYSSGGVESFDFCVLQKIFEYWWSPVQFETLTTDAQNLRSRLMTYFAGLISSLLRSESLAATYLLTATSKYSEGLVIDRCCGVNLEPGGANETQANASVLDSLLYCDLQRFAPYFLSRFTENNFIKSFVWEHGLLDGVAKQLIARLASTCIWNSSLLPLVSATLSRATSVLEKAKEAEWQGEWLGALSTLDLANDALLTRLLLPDEKVVATTSELLCFPLEDKTLFRMKMFARVGRLGMTIFHLNSVDSFLSGKQKSILASSLFCALSELLLIQYKCVVHRNEPIDDIDCATVLAFLTTLVAEHGREFEPSIVGRANKTLLQKVCRAALKHGIHVETESQLPVSLASRSLKYVRVLSEQLFRLPILYEHFTTITPSELFSMVRSHSKFTPMITRKKGPQSDETDRIELVRLMQCCVELSQESPLDIELLKLLSVAFGAGLDEFDKCVRQFFYLCSTLESKNIKAPFLDEVRWDGCPKGESREHKRWEWLDDALDLNRIKETAARFPIDDGTSLRAESHQPKTSEHHDETRAGAHDDSDEEDEGYGKGGNDAVRKFTPMKRMRFSEAREDPVQKTDSGYSPAFILPLILGALHAGFSDIDNQSEINKSGKIENPDGVSKEDGKKYGPFVAAVRRLVDKGVPAMCLASLASSCGSVRTLAISILGILLKVCDSDEARAMASWRDRPQVVLLLNAVQRAYIVQRAESENNGIVPSLSPLVATFLAKSSLSIAKPDDPMYEPLNRFFLKSDADHGAFQDMSRLPGFIALFCSASDDPLQSRKERIWALQLIRDGFLNASCYRLVSSCHATELLLSAFENVRLSPFSPEMKSVEYNLLLDALKTFLDHGGRKASAHLIGRIGLLSWIRSLCTARPVEVLFPIASTRAKICELIESAATSLWKNPSFFKAPLVDEICGLISPTLEMTIYGEAEKDGVKSIVGQANRTLLAIGEIIYAFVHMEEAELPQFHASGMNLKDSLAFLKLLSPGDMHKIITLFCYLPLHLDPATTEKTDAAEFCCSLLDWYSHGTTGDPDDTANAALQRVVFIADQFAGDFSTEVNVKLTRKLLASRARYQGTEETSLLWIESLELLSLRLPDGFVEAQLAVDALNQT